MAISAGPPVPMVLVALVRWLRGDAGWGDAPLVKALTAVDSYVARAAVCLTGISNLRSQFMVICGNLDGLSKSITLTDFKAAMTGKKTNAEVATAIKTLPLYEKMRSDALLAVLRGIESALTTAGGAHSIAPSGVQRGTRFSAGLV